MTLYMTIEMKMMMNVNVRVLLPGKVNRYSYNLK